MNSDLWNRQITADVVKSQRDSVCANIGSYTYIFSFSRERIEIERMNQTRYPEFSAQHERMARFSQFITYYEEHQQGDGSVIYDVGITISPGQALQVLSNRSVLFSILDVS